MTKIDETACKHRLALVASPFPSERPHPEAEDEAHLYGRTAEGSRRCGRAPHLQCSARGVERRRETEREKQGQRAKQKQDFPVKTTKSDVQPKATKLFAR